VRRVQGLYNNHGYVQIRIWPQGKAVNPAPYVEKGFGCWCDNHKAIAAKRLRILRDEIDSGKFIKNQQMRVITFGEAWDIFFNKQYVKTNRSPGTVRCAVTFGAIFKSLWGNVPLHEMTPKHIKEDLIDDSTVGTGTLRNRLFSLGQMFTCLDNWVKTKEIDSIKLPEFNPVSPIEKPSYKFVGRKHLELGELQRLKEWCLKNDPDLWVAAYAAMTTLLRHGDLNKAADNESLYGVASKTGKVFLLPGSITKGIHIKGFSYRWSKARKACGIEWFHWHWLRAQGGKIMRLLGVPETTVQEIYQHSTVRQTREYTGDAEWAAPAIEKVRNYLDNIMNAKS